MNDAQAIALMAIELISDESTEVDVKEALKKAANILELAAEEVWERQETSREDPHVVSPSGRKRPSYWNSPG